MTWAESPAVARWATLAAPVVLLAIVAGSGLMGLDYGYHWDEHLNLLKIANTVRSHLLLPRWYDYPAMIYWISLLVIAPTIPYAMRSQSFHLLAFVDSRQYLLENRVVFILIASLAALWIYIAVLKWRGRWTEALLAAGFLGLSWETAYHSRFVAPDAIMMQFGAMALMFVVLAYVNPQNRTLLRLAAIASGLATATKYPAGLFVVPLVILTVMNWDRQSVLRGLLPMLAEVGFLFGLAYLIVTPGTILEPDAFIASLKQTQRIYSKGMAYHTVGRGLDHLGRMALYFSLQAFSHFRALAALIFAMLLVGVVALARESWRAALLFFSFPVAYLLFFVVDSRTMIVRNVLILLPFFAIFAARGVAWIVEQLKDWRLRAAVTALAALALIVNAGWLFYAAGTIQSRGTDRFVREFAQYLEAHPTDPVYLSPKVTADLIRVVGSASFPGVVDSPAQAADYALYYSELCNVPPGNDLNLVKRWFGPYETNWVYYVSWGGDDRILLMPVGKYTGEVGCGF